MTINEGRSGKYYVTPAGKRDPYAAGYDGNVFDTREEAERAIPDVARSFDTNSSDWAVERYDRTF